MATAEDWIGRQDTCEDVIDYGLVKRMAATLNAGTPAPESPLPPLWHWMYFQPALAHHGLGEDGHPARGGFMPPVDNRNRMWAGGRLDFHKPLLIGMPAQRISTIRNVVEKQGRTGALLFVTVEHHYMQDGASCIVEQQDIVYREPSKPKLAATTPCPLPEWSQRHQPDTALLFRYSAVTFNAHRIHYDYPYVTQKEGYPNIVVQGQLLATLALNAYQQANPTASLTAFAFRSQRPMIIPDQFDAAGRLTGEGTAELWVGNENGVAQSCDVVFRLNS